MDYILFGIQGSGKGTHGKIMAQRLSAAYFETGGELRRLAAENSPLGEKVKSIIEVGHLVPTEVVMEIVENFIKQNSGPIIFDGIPRNDEQNRALLTLFKKWNRTYTGIYFELSREEAMQRLLKRRMCGTCKTVYPPSYTQNSCEKCGGPLITRADDNVDSIGTRLDIFYKETLPIAEEWKSRGKLITVNSSGTIEKVAKELFSKVLHS